MTQKVIMSVIGLLCVALLGGCNNAQTSEPNSIDRSELNRAVLESYSDLAIQNAIITQSTLYPYHFVSNSARLNTLGKRDMGVLIRHFAENPGQLSVQQGSVSDQLYQDRRQVVYKALVAGGIAEKNIVITNDMPGGSGMLSNDVIKIVQEESAESSSYETDVMSVQVGQ